ncbi:MAG TPA: hypothetical protein VG742_08605 [Dongiaceae bacterium]|nr:hypothetical protein [Dongiaceae bacterium]
MTSIFRISVLVGGGLLAALFLAVPAASAEGPPAEGRRTPVCFPHEQLEGELRQAYNEKKLGHGVSGDGNLIEIFMSSAGNFTVIKTSPAGVSCIVDFGEGWRTIDPLETAQLKALDAPQYSER